MADIQEVRILLGNIEKEGSETLEGYIAYGGFKALNKVFKSLKPEKVIKIIEDSGLRGRGGAGFPTGMKLKFTAGNEAEPKYIVCNADEGEPGTFKDREILEKDPFLLIEGMIIAGFAISSNKGYIYLRAEYPLGRDILIKAINEAHKKNYLGKNILGSGYNFDIEVFNGAGAYICGEETALIESLEGKIGQSRMKPPFPVNEGLYRKPTALNNVETLAYLPHIIQKGAKWFRQYGTEASPGTKIYTVSGHVKNPGFFELPMDVTLRQLIFDMAGGIRDDNLVKAVFPGGSSSSCLTEKNLDVVMDYNCLAEIKSMLGTGAVIVIDDKTCMVEVALNAARFYHHESCGKCNPCRKGTHWLLEILELISKGKGKISDLDLIEDISEEMMAAAFCPFGQAAPNPIISSIRNFKEDFVTHIETGKCGYKKKRR